MAAHRRFQFLRRLARAAALSVIGLTVSFATTAAPDEKTLDWAMTILLGAEYGQGDRVVVHWAHPPTLSIFGGSTENRAVIKATVEQINGILNSTPIGSITMLGPADKTASLQVHFAPLARFPDLAQSLGFVYYPENWGYFWFFWNKNHEIESAYVLLATDRLYGSSMRHFALEEMTQSLGLANDSPIFSDSIFYAQGYDGGSAQHLSDSDQKLLRFLYNFVLPGTKAPELKSLLLEHWDEL